MPRLSWVGGKDYASALGGGSLLRGKMFLRFSVADPEAWTAAGGRRPAMACRAMARGIGLFVPCCRAGCFANQAGAVGGPHTCDEKIRHSRKPFLMAAVIAAMIHYFFPNEPLVAKWFACNLSCHRTR